MNRRRVALIVYAVIAATIAISDQLLKMWVVDNFQVNTPSPVLGDWFRIDFIHNGGGLFGMLQGSAPLFAVITILVVVVLVAVQVNSGWRSWLVTVTLALLLGGAIGNFVDRIRFGYVIDFADIGIGNSRFYIFNVADSAITIAILLMFVLWFAAPRMGHSDGEPDPANVTGTRTGSGTEKGR
jgi:signal peptidase II